MNRREGRKLTKNSFMEGLRNIAYCGKLFLKAYNDEEEKIVEGKHEALISEELFMKVQRVLHRKAIKMISYRQEE